MVKEIKPSVMLVALLVLLVLIFSPLPKPAYGGFGGGGIFAYLLQPGTNASSSAFNAAPGLDTILNVTEAGLLHSIIVEVESVDVTGVPEVDLLLTVDGTARAITLYNAATTFPTWASKLSQVTSTAGTTGSYLLQDTTFDSAQSISGTTGIKTVLSATGESGILHGIRIDVQTNVTGGTAEVTLRLVVDGVARELSLYNVADTWTAPTFDATGVLANVVERNAPGGGATANDDIDFALDIPYQNSLFVGYNVIAAATAGSLNTTVVRSTQATGGGGSSGSVVGSRFKLDLNDTYLRSLLVQVDRNVVGTSASTLNLTVMRSTRL